MTSLVPTPPPSCSSSEVSPSSAGKRKAPGPLGKSLPRQKEAYNVPPANAEESPVKKNKNGGIMVRVRVCATAENFGERFAIGWSFVCSARIPS